MKKTLLTLAAGLLLGGCCGAGSGVPKANLYWPLTFGYDQVTPTTQTQPQTVPMVPAYQPAPTYIPAPQYAPAAAPCR